MEHVRARGCIRERGGKLEAVLAVPGRKRRVTRSTCFDVGQEAEADAFLATLLAELGAALEGEASMAAPAAAARGEFTLQSWGESGWQSGTPGE